ncbi:MAG TPA: nucleoid-associated protein, YbaB/EbfC family [Flavobacteriaceae bacterium]|jgi:DNA-binding YbaB/EbfC family protein|nr:nucleoid-associated protein, YbaB/EbfC family [Flavobacteriaceae bacterium]HBS11053.1 nucleoid-associated protein, YbaB/EbfC family [Flavobacteriaceae bacterium]
MFGDLSGMMEKLKEAQQKIEETKARLNTVLVDGESGNGKVKVTVTANREIRNIDINDELLKDSDELEDYLVIALNNALEKANEINEAEMAAAAKGGMPDIPGLDMLM